MFDTIQKRQITPEPVEETSFFTSSSDSEVVAPKPSSPTSSLEDEEDDKFDDDSGIYSFSKFSNLHFQGNATHTHITQRLRQSLLKHEDEGDALVRAQAALFLPSPPSPSVSPASPPLLLLQACLTVWWIILRFMEDLPEPKSLDTVSQASSTMSRLQPPKQGRRLSHLVGLDQVKQQKTQLLHFYTYIKVS